MPRDKPKFPLTSLIKESISSFELIVILTASVLAAANGVGLPLLPVLFAENIANFSSLYNPGLAGIQSASDEQLDADSITQNIQKTSYLILIFAAAAAVSTFLLSFIQARTAKKIAGRIRIKYFSALMRQDVSWYNKQTTGDLSTRVTGIDVIEQVLGQTAVQFFRDVFAILAGFVLAFTNSWRMTLVVLSFMPILAITGAFIAFIVRRETKKYHESQGRADSAVHESFSMIKTVLAYSGQGIEEKLYLNSLQEVFKFQNRRAVASAVGTGTLMLVLISCFSTAFWFGSLFVRRGDVSLSGAIAASSIVPGVFAAFRLANVQKLIGIASASAQLLLNVIQNYPSIDPLSTAGIVPDTFKGDLKFEDVSFEYEEKKEGQKSQILNNITMHIESGRSHAIVGPSGSGKSTLFSLISRQYDVSTGRIVLDGDFNISEVNVKWLRSQIGHVGQNPILFQGTIRENIEMGVPSIDEDDFEADQEYRRPRPVTFDDILEAAKIANAHEFISKLPGGYDTHIGSGGAQLSGGQKQRICIARAIVRKPKLLLLDESTASLDNQSEKIVQRALERASQNRTTISIAHKISTIQACDKIYVMSNGEVCEKGNHEELMGIENGTYRKMVHLQNTEQRNDNLEQSLEMVSETSSKDLEKLLLGGETQGPSELDASSNISQGQDTTDTDEDWRPRMRNINLRILSWQKPEYHFMGLGFLGSAAAGSSWPLAAACISELLHIGAIDDNTSEVRKWLLLLFGCGVASFMGIIIQNTFLSLCGESLTKRLRMRLFSSLIHHNMSFFDKTENSPGSLTVKLSSQVSRIRELTGDSLGSIIVAVTSTLTGATIALYYCWRVALVGLIFMPGILLSGVSSKYTEFIMCNIKHFSAIAKPMHSPNLFNIQPLIFLSWP